MKRIEQVLAPPQMSLPLSIVPAVRMKRWLQNISEGVKEVQGAQGPMTMFDKFVLENLNLDEYLINNLARCFPLLLPASSAQIRSGLRVAIRRASQRKILRERSVL
jgi:hypothetical protein